MNDREASKETHTQGNRPTDVFVFVFLGGGGGCPPGPRAAAAAETGDDVRGRRRVVHGGVRGAWRDRGAAGGVLPGRAGVHQEAPPAPAAQGPRRLLRRRPRVRRRQDGGRRAVGRGCGDAAAGRGSGIGGNASSGGLTCTLPGPSSLTPM